MFEVSGADVADLRDRLRRIRWAARWPMTSWAAGTDPDELRRLVGYWSESYDWRAHEAAINALPWHTTEVSGVKIGYLRYDSADPDALPIVITHGWPSTVLELTGLARRLADRAFTVIVPALPGFPGTPQQDTLAEAVPTHELWHRLMHDELGFERYAAHGGDLGAGISARLGQAHPEAVTGIHVLAVANPPDYDPAGLTAEERAYLDAEARWDDEEGAYQHQQMTRPVTLGYGLADSPVGLLAWLLEKYRGWTDTPGFDDDFVLTQASLYWFTNTIATSFRPYYEYRQGISGRTGRVGVPTAVALFPQDLSQPPQSWAERTYNVVRYSRMPRGGHFAAYEEPELVADDITAHFTALRRSETAG